MTFEEIKRYDWSWVYAYLEEKTVFDTACMEEQRRSLINLVETLQSENELFKEALIKIGSVHAKHPRELSVIANEALFKAEYAKEKAKE